MKSKRNKHFLVLSGLSFLLCAINLYVMDFKTVNLLFGVLPFFIAGIGYLCSFIFQKKK